MEPPRKQLRYSKQQVIDALVAAKGMMTQAARLLGCQTKTLYKYKERFPEIQETLDNEREKLLDVAEIALAAAVAERAPWAISYTLSTIGKTRGYSQAVVHKTEKNAPLVLQLVWEDPLADADAEPAAAPPGAADRA